MGGGLCRGFGAVGVLAACGADLDAGAVFVGWGCVGVGGFGVCVGWWVLGAGCGGLFRGCGGGELQRDLGGCGGGFGGLGVVEAGGLSQIGFPVIGRACDHAASRIEISGPTR